MNRPKKKKLKAFVVVKDQNRQGSRFFWNLTTRVVKSSSFLILLVTMCCPGLTYMGRRHHTHLNMVLDG